MTRSTTASGGASRAQPGEERLDRAGGALDLDEHAVGVVAHPAGQPQAGRQPVHERPEPDPLDHPGDPDPGPHQPVAGADSSLPALESSSCAIVAASTRLATPNLRMMCETCTLAVLALIVNSAAISRLVYPQLG